MCIELGLCIEDLWPILHNCKLGWKLPVARKDPVHSMSELLLAACGHGVFEIPVSKSLGNRSDAC